VAPREAGVLKLVASDTATHGAIAPVESLPGGGGHLGRHAHRAGRPRPRRNPPHVEGGGRRAGGGGAWPARLGALATTLTGLISTIENASPILTFTYLPVILFSRGWTNSFGR
jgi:hypothetical protein